MNLLPLVLVVASLSFPFAALAEKSVEEDIHETAKITGDSTEVVRGYYEKCASGVTLQMVECSQYLRKAADKELNELYQQLLHKHGRGSTAGKKLIDAQRAWIPFRDATCDYESEGYTGGSLHGAMVLSCLADHTKRRSTELKAYLAVMVQ